MNEPNDTVSEAQVSVTAMGESIREFSSAMTNMVQTWIKTLAPFWDAMNRTIETIHEVWWQAYRGAGMPYGESDNGMYRWVQEMAAIEGLRREADERESWLQFLAAFRRQHQRGDRVRDHARLHHRTTE